MGDLALDSDGTWGIWFPRGITSASWLNGLPCPARVPAARGRCGRPAASACTRLADELAAEGLVEFIDNPKHRRSKLVQLTPKGGRRYRELNARFLAIASALGVGLSEGVVRRRNRAAAER